MVTLDELKAEHIKAYKDLDRYEVLVDNLLRAQIKNYPLNVEFTIRVDNSTLPRSVADSLVPKYKAAGWQLQTYDYPTIRLLVIQQTKFLKTCKDSILAENKPTEQSKRSIKLPTPVVTNG